MTLSKQLYIIISFIFMMIFIGNFFISTTNFKNYLEEESTTKSQDTATSLGMSLKSLINNKKDPEIESTIKAIANRGFYKEIRLEDIKFTITKEELLQGSQYDSNTKIVEVNVDAKDGKIKSSNEVDSFESELLGLDAAESVEQGGDKVVYTFLPAQHFPNNKTINITYKVDDGEKIITNTTQITINKILVKVSRVEKFESVPQWFIDAIPMKMVETKSEISNGWTTEAIIYVSANAGEAYSKLYTQAKNSLYYALISFSISYILLVIFLQFILKPLLEIESLAKNISKGQFETIKKLPWTKELKNVSISMNDMSDKIKNMITKLNQNLEKMTEQLSQDDLTGLQLEQTFQTDMKQMFIKKIDGYIFSVKIDNLIDFAKNNPNNVVEKFLKEFASVLEKSDEGIKAYRFFGSTFAMISHKNLHEDILKITNKLKNELENLSKKYGIISVAHIGVTPFNEISTTHDILALANEACEMSKQIGHNEAYIRDKDDLARDMLAWKELIFDIIDNRTFNVEFINKAHSMDGEKTLLMEEAFTSATDKNSIDIPIGTFISIAEKYNKVIDFDKAVILKVIEYIKTNAIAHEILINLSFDSIISTNFKNWTVEQLNNNSDIAHQLIFSLTSYSCTRDLVWFKKFIDIVHENGAKIILKRFETKFIPLDNLKEFNLDYIRLARDYTQDITKDKSKQSFVESVCELSKLLNIKVFAESVKDDASFTILSELGIFGASK